MCKAKNDFGEDITKCKLVCKELPAIQLENQVPKGMKKSEYLMQMEASMKKYAQVLLLLLLLHFIALLLIIIVLFYYCRRSC